MEDGKGDRFQYDEEGQLTVASYRAQNPEGGATNAARFDNFVYDKVGNRKGWNDIASRGHIQMLRRDNGINQYVSWGNSSSGSAVSYDDNLPPPPPGPSPTPQWNWVWPGNGVMMQDGYVTASFNALNQPIAIWSSVYGTGAAAQYVWFGYDPLGRCVKRWIGSANANAPNSNPATYYYYDGWNLIEEGTATTFGTRKYVHGGRVDEIIASKVDGQWLNHHYDARGHCIMLTSNTGAVFEQYEYDAFGYPYSYNGAAQKVARENMHTRFLFTGREYFWDLRLYDYRNRMYQPELGRFLQPDPKEFEAGDYNLYRYCHNDPINKTDPTGLDTEFGKVPVPILKVGIEAAQKSNAATSAAGDGMERGAVGLQSRGNSNQLSTSSVKEATGIPYIGPQRTNLDTPETGLGQQSVITGHNHVNGTDHSAADKDSADHSKTPSVITRNGGNTFRVYVPAVNAKGQVLNRGGVTEEVTPEGIHVFTRDSGNLTPNR